jgi:signal transduction histidine kinase
VLQRRDPAIISGTAPAQSANEASVAESSADDAVCSRDDEMFELMGFAMKRVLTGLVRLPKPWIIFLALVLAVLVGGLDYATGYDLQVTAFYLIPICWACWGVGRKAGLFLAVACIAIWGVANLLTSQIYLFPMILVWNALMLLAIFVVAVYSVTSFLNAYRSLAETQALLRNSNERLEETVQQRTAALRAEMAERQRLEQATLQAERLLARQEKLATLGTLTAGIAHEIRNPLTSLKARLYTLEKHLLVVPAARKDTDIISAEISRLEHIVQDVLSFARPADPKLETITVDTLLREIQGLMSPNLESHKVQLVVESSPELLVRADSGHLKQALINLARNAAEAIDGTGTVTLRARAARAQLGGRETEAVILEVSDTGKGISPEVEKRLFDPFFSTKETGTGLGLPISARLIQKQGGTLQYQTRPGHGTTFGVVLPREINDTAESENSNANIQTAGDQANR